MAGETKDNGTKIHLSLSQFDDLVHRMETLEHQAKGSDEDKRKGGFVEDENQFNEMIQRIETLEQRPKESDEGKRKVRFVEDDNQFNEIIQRIETLEQRPKESDEEKVGLLGGEKENAGDSPQNDEAKEVVLSESMVEANYDKYELPESTFTHLMTAQVLSIPFLSGIVSFVLQAACLILALWNGLDERKPGNKYGFPAGVRWIVQAAQVLGIMIGVLMEQEIPQALELIGKGAEQRIVRKSGFSSHSQFFSAKRIILPAVLRMVVGGLFLATLFLTVMQESVVLDIFFDVLALEFVERIDDIIFALSKKGFFGRKLRVATNQAHFIQTTKKSHPARRRTKRVIRIFFIAVALGMIIMFAIITKKQENGYYRCNHVSVDFGDALWEEAYVRSAVGGYDKRLLIYSHFNGVYVESGKFGGRPRYEEQNKGQGDPFKRTIPAEIVYCGGDVEAWVLRHPNITKIQNEDACDWLLRSPRTESYDLIELAEETEWFVWIGKEEGQEQPHYQVSIDCSECYSSSECNHGGTCNEKESTGNYHVKKCDCNYGYFGHHCQFKRPCRVIRSGKDNTTTLDLIPASPDDEVNFHEMYGKPVYWANLSGKPYSLLRHSYPNDDDPHSKAEYHTSIGNHDLEDLVPHRHFNQDAYADDDFFEVNNSSEFQELLKNYTFMLSYTGSRWYGQIMALETVYEIDVGEYHAFWGNILSGFGEEDNSTLIISEAAPDSSFPVGVDFYEMRRRNSVFEGGIFDYDYGPYGVLIPLVAYGGAGFFHCNKDDN